MKRLDEAAKALAWYFGESSAALGDRSSWRESGGYGTGSTEVDRYTDATLGHVSRARSIRAALLTVGADTHNLLACVYSPRRHGRPLRVAAGDDLAGLVIRILADRDGLSVAAASTKLDGASLDQVRKLVPTAKALLERAIQTFADAWQTKKDESSAERRERRQRAFEEGLG